MSGVSGLDVLALLDIIKNEELYTAKLNEIKSAEASLAEAKFIAATVAQANKYREEAVALKKEAAELKQRVEQEMDAKKKKVESELSELRSAYEKDMAEVRAQKLDIQLKLNTQRDLQKKNALDSEALRKREQELTLLDAATINKQRKLQNTMGEIREQLMKEFANG